MSINRIIETGGAGDWGTDKARARLQKDTPGQEITKGKKMKTFKDILNNIDESSTNIEEALQQVHTIKITANAPSNPKPSEVADIKNDFKLYVQATRAAIKSAGGLITDTEVPSRQNKFVGTIKIGTRGDASKLDVKSIQKAVKSGGIELHDKQFEDIQEAMSDADKKKRLALIKRAVEKFRRQEFRKAQKAAMADMKAAGMFDEEVELQEAVASVNKSLEDLVQIGGIDKKDFQKALDLYKAGNLNGLRKHIYRLDTDPSETIAAIIVTGDDASFMKMYPNAKGGEYLRSIIISRGGK